MRKSKFPTIEFDGVDLNTNRRKTVAVRSGAWGVARTGGTIAACKMILAISNCSFAPDFRSGKFNSFRIKKENN
jgi:hypothetical protein